jgi:hypothetical protein
MVFSIALIDEINYIEEAIGRLLIEPAADPGRQAFCLIKQFINGYEENDFIDCC